MSLPIDESIQRLKTEILSQDWTLPRRKIEPLQAAFACLKERFVSRKGALDILTMAENILAYAQRREGAVHPDFVDFLKEAMAHVVNLHEEEDPTEPDGDLVLRDRLYRRFNRLKEKARAARRTGETPPPDPDQEQTVLPEDLFPLISDLLDGEPEADIPTALVSDAGTVNDGQPTEVPVAPEVPGAEGDLEAQSRQVPVDTGESSDGPEAIESSDPPGSTEPPRVSAPAGGLRKLPAWAVVRPVIAGEVECALAEKYIALIKPLSPRKRTGYIREGQVPLRDMVGFFTRLSSQVRGPLVQLGERNLKQLNLPLVHPEGEALSAFSPLEAAWLVVVSNGSRHGVLLVDFLEKEADTLASFSKDPDGDRAGLGRFADGQEIHVLDVQRMLGREGLFAAP